MMVNRGGTLSGVGGLGFDKGGATKGGRVVDLTRGALSSSSACLVGWRKGPMCVKHFPITIRQDKHN